MTDWQVGDLALCVESDWVYPISGVSIAGPEKGQCLRVVGIFGPVYCCPTCGELTGLKFSEYPMPSGWDSDSFRKIDPLTRDEHDEFLTDLEFDSEVAERISAYFP